MHKNETPETLREKTIEECARWLEDMPEHWRTLAEDMRRALSASKEPNDGNEA